MSTHARAFFVVVAMGGSLWTSFPAFSAMRDQPAPDKPAPPPPAAERADPAKTDKKHESKPASDPGAIPDLDSLLGTKPEKASDTQTPDGKSEAVDPSKKELARQLSLQEQADEFARAVELMNETADRIEQSSDPGLATQRLQEDILTRLDRLIKAAEQNRSSKSKQQQSGKESDKNKNMRQQSQSTQARSNDSSDKADGPAREDGSLGNLPVAPPASWGDLPAHVRDALLQGFSDRFSSMYQGMTESYYRRLAEEKKK